MAPRRSQKQSPPPDSLFDHWMIKAGIWAFKGLLAILLTLGVYVYNGNNAKVMDAVDRIEEKVDASVEGQKSLEDIVRAIVDEFREYKAAKNAADAALHEKVSGHEERISTLERKEAQQRREEWEASFKAYMDERAAAARKKK